MNEQNVSSVKLSYFTLKSIIDILKKGKGQVLFFCQGNCIFSKVRFLISRTEIRAKTENLRPIGYPKSNITLQFIGSRWSNNAFW